LGEFAAALNYLDSSISGLLKCVGFFYEPALPPRFGLIYQLPINSPGGFASFKDVIAARDSSGRRLKLKYSLNHRLEFAKKLAMAVFFVHSIGWVHKAIRPQNILLMRKQPEKEGGNEPTSIRWALYSPYLVGFEVARSNDGDTNPGARSRTPLEVGLYMHPDLQENELHVRCTMAHDVYSLGVVLLELGIWAPLEERPEIRREMTPAEEGVALLNLANETELLMGRRYREVVQFCLAQGHDGDSGGVRPISDILEKLEDLAQSV
jgi:serine/threonine protein kinase